MTAQARSRCWQFFHTIVGKCGKNMLETRSVLLVGLLRPLLSGVFLQKSSFKLYLVHSVCAISFKGKQFSSRFTGIITVPRKSPFSIYFLLNARRCLSLLPMICEGDCNHYCCFNISLFFIISYLYY